MQLLSELVEINNNGQPTTEYIEREFWSCVFKERCKRPNMKIRQ